MKEINYADLVFHPTNMLANEWMIVCAGNQDTGYNGMTVSWGHFGSIWGYDGKHNLPTILVYVRPSRYTLGFIEKEEYFTVNLSSLNKNDTSSLNDFDTLDMCIIYYLL